MKLLFSEAKSDYGNYLFPYAIWAFAEAGETPADMFAHGFLPSSRQLDRFYLCRQIRIPLGSFKPSSENRRILRKGEGISSKMVPRSEFDYTNTRRQFYKDYADRKFGPDVMSWERLDGLFSSPIVSHLLVFTDTENGREVGTVTLYCEEPRMAFYYYAFYDLNYFARSLGLYMMTTAVKELGRRRFEHLYLGSCYSTNALYKTQFAGAQFFNGFGWSGNLEELKYAIRHDSAPIKQHLLETEEFQELFHSGDLSAMAAKTPFAVRPERP